MLIFAGLFSTIFHITVIYGAVSDSHSKLGIPTESLVVLMVIQLLSLTAVIWYVLRSS